MRVLSLKQPWAQLICLGLKDIEGRTWDTPYRGKILIHASSAKPTKNFMSRLYYEDACEIKNQLIFGNLPDLRTLPTSAIIGYATLTDIVDESDSPWAYPDLKNWVLKDAHLFKTPITGVNGKLNLWNYPEISEDSLPPAYTADLQFPTLWEGKMEIPISEESLDIALENGCLELEWSKDFQDIIYGENRKENNIVNSVVLISPTRLVRISEVDAFDRHQKTEDGGNIMEPCKNGKYIPHTVFAIEFKSRPEIFELTKQDVIDYCAEHCSKPWFLDKEGLKTVMHEALVTKSGEIILDGYYSGINPGILISKINEPFVDDYNPSDQEIATYCEEYGINRQSLDDEEIETVMEELSDIHRGKKPGSSILFWKSDKPLKELFND